CKAGTDGNIEYWYCGVCETYFSDAEAGENSKMEKEDTVVAWAHTYTKASEGENAWHWYVSADGTTYTATVDLKCAICEKTQTVDAEVSGPDANSAYTGTYTFSEDVVFTDTHTPSEEDETRPETGTYTVEITNVNKDCLVVYVNGGTLTLTAVVKDGEGNEVAVQSGELVWSVVTGYEGYAVIEQDTGIVTGEEQGTAAFVATYTDGNNLAWTSGIVYVIVQPEVQTPDGSPYSVSVDFGNPSEDLKTSIQTGGTIVVDEKGLLTLVDTSSEWSVGSGYLSTGTNGYTKQTTDVYTYTNYFMLDFAGFGGYSYEITLTFASASGEGSVAIMNALVENAGGSGTPTEIFHTDSAPDLSEDVSLGHGKKATGTGMVEWTYSGTAGTDGGTVLYLVWDSTMQIYGIDIELWTGERPVNLDKDTWSGVEIDFANPPDEFNLTYGNPESYTGDGRTVMSGGVFTIIDSDYKIEWTSGNDYMTTGGATGKQQYPEAEEDAALTNYIKINLGGLEGQSVVITIVFSSAEGSEGTLAIVTAPEDLSGGGDATNLVGNDTSATVTTKTKFSVVVTVPADGIMYIEYNASLKIYSIKISLGSEPDTSADYTVEIDDVSVDSTTLDVGDTATGFVAKITENGIEKQLSDIAGAALEWKSSNTEVATVTVDSSGNVTVTAISSGYAKITVVLTVGDTVIESGAIGILVNIGAAGEDTLRYNFTSSSEGWDTTLNSTSSTISLDESDTLKYHTSEYNQGWKKDPDGVYGFMTGEKDDYGATFGSSENYSNYFEIATGNAIAMTISVTFSATSVKQEGYWVESQGAAGDTGMNWYEPEDNSTGFVALLPSLPGYTVSVGGSTTATRRGYLTDGTLTNGYQSYLINSTAIMDTEGVGYSNAVTFTWTGSVKDYDKIYIFLGAS
ncbi:MAG: hypothetical protein LUD72_07305, partial [Bacteroidales bacterium]|nr:hypothetical protein [Bacteroidales bacterium]